MPASPGFDSSVLPRPPAGRGARAGAAERAFAPAFEAEYVRSRLHGNRALIRITCTLAALIAAARGAETSFSEPWHDAQVPALVTVLALSIALAGIAWSRFYERLYMPLAEIAVPARNTLAAIFIAGAAVNGRSELLMVLPLMVVGPFFFLGLRFRPALLSVVLTIAAFATGALVFELAAPVAFSSTGLLLIATVGSVVGARHLEQASRRSFVAGHEMAEQARIDALTGLTNRRVFDERLDELWLNATEESASIAVFLIDIDHFKAHNDTYGHQAGDRALRRVAQTLQGLISGPGNLIARYGGEEFAVLLDDADTEQAQALAQRMRRAVGELALRDGAAVTVSIGVAVVEPSDERRPRGALQLADQALYEAKRRGRNRVEVMDQAAHRMLETGVFPVDSFARGQSLSAAGPGSRGRAANLSVTQSI